MKCSYLGYLCSAAFAKLTAATNFSQETDVRETVDYTKISLFFADLEYENVQTFCARRFAYE